MDKFRVNSGAKIGVKRAANGDFLSNYGEIGSPAPVEYATIRDDDLEPMDRFVVEWLLNPFVDYIGPPWRWILRHMPIFGKSRLNNKSESESVELRAINAVARALVCVSAVLSLIVPIATLNAIQYPTLRIVVMALYAQAFAITVECLGVRSMPIFTLITG